MPSPEPASPTISVVVPSVGRAVLAEVVRAALEQHPFEVIVVADRRPDAVRKLLAEAIGGDARVAIVEAPGGDGGRARQIGLEAATGDVVLFLDDDVVPEPGLLDGHRRAHGPERVVVGYLPVAPHLVATQVTSAIYAGDYEAECAMLDRHPDRTLRMVWGGNLSVGRADALLVGPAVDSWSRRPRQDQEFGFRCLRAGFHGTFERSLRAVHHHERSVGEFLSLARRQTVAGRELAVRYPDLMDDADPTAGLSWRLRAVGTVSSTPGVGPLVRRSVVALAVRVGAGAPTFWRLRLVLLARALVQFDATRD